MAGDSNYSKITAFELSCFMGLNILAAGLSINPTCQLYQDAWIGYLIALGGGFVSLALYLKIYSLNPTKSLVQMLQSLFGNPIGIIISLSYVCYFIFTAAIDIRIAVDVMGISVYPDAKPIFTTFLSMITITYIGRYGFENTSRHTEIFTYVMILTVLFAEVAFTMLSKPINILPVGEIGFETILPASYSIFSYMFGGFVVFLMIFRNVSDKTKVKKYSYRTLLIAGIVVLTYYLHAIMVLSPRIAANMAYPFIYFPQLIEKIRVEPIVNLLLVISIGFKMYIFVHAATVGLMQIIGTTEYRPIYLSLSAMVTVLSFIVFENHYEMRILVRNILPYIATPFQIVIPVIILFLLFTKNYRTQTDKDLR